jgi:hypothetical protein
MNTPVSHIDSHAQIRLLCIRITLILVLLGSVPHSFGQAKRVPPIPKPVIEKISQTLIKWGVIAEKEAPVVEKQVANRLDVLDGLIEKKNIFDGIPPVQIPPARQRAQQLRDSYHATMAKLAESLFEDVDVLPIVLSAHCDTLRLELGGHQICASDYWQIVAQAFVRSKLPEVPLYKAREIVDALITLRKDLWRDTWNDETARRAYVDLICAASTVQ